MQLLRVASTMSYQGSPYSGQGDEYDFEDDGYDDLEEYRIQEEPLPPPSLMDDSDEGIVYDLCSPPVLISFMTFITPKPNITCLFIRV